MLVTTTDSIPGKEITNVLGYVSGCSVQSCGMEKSGMAFFKSFKIKGGEIKEMAEATTQNRNTALERMQEQAMQMGANAVIGVRVQLNVLSSTDSSNLSSASTESYAYGTAVVVQ